LLHGIDGNGFPDLFCSKSGRLIGPAGREPIAATRVGSPG